MSDHSCCHGREHHAQRNENNSFVGPIRRKGIGKKCHEGTDEKPHQEYYRSVHKKVKTDQLRVQLSVRPSRPPPSVCGDQDKHAHPPTSRAQNPNLLLPLDECDGGEGSPFRISTLISPPAPIGRRKAHAILDNPPPLVRARRKVVPGARLEKPHLVGFLTSNCGQIMSRPRPMSSHGGRRKRRLSQVDFEHGLMVGVDHLLARASAVGAPCVCCPST